MTDAPGAEPQRPTFAGPWRRLLANSLDYALLGALTWGAGSLAFAWASGVGPEGYWLGLAFGIAYFALGNGRLGGGATLGKRALGIRTLGGDGRPPGLLPSLLRAGVLIAPPAVFGLASVGLSVQLAIAVAPAWALAYLVLFHGPAGRTLHDAVAGSAVFRRGREGAVPPFRAVHGAVALAFAIAVFGLVAWAPPLREQAREDEGLTALQAQVMEAADARHAALWMGAHRFEWTTAPSKHVSSLVVSVRLPHPPTAADSVMDRVVEVVLLDYPAARGLDRIVVDLHWGFDWFLGRRFERATLEGTPAEWQARIEPAAELPPARLEIDEEFEALLALAEQGEPEAMALVGFRLVEGSPEEIVAGLGWLELAAEAGVPGAQYALAGAIRDGRISGTPEQARAWMTGAAEQGHADAQFELGRMFEYGYGGAPDLEGAIAWHRRAADQGNASAINELGTFLARGKGFIQDRTEAARLYEAAAETGDATAQFNLAVRLRSGDSVPKDLGRSAYWAYRAAMQGDGRAQNLLGVAYLHGQGVEKDVPVGLRWFERAARTGNVEAYRNLGAVYHRGHVVPRDLEGAARWYERAVAAGDKNSLYPLVALAAQDEVEIEDAEGRVAAVRELGEQGDVQALLLLASLHRRGFVVEQDELRAFSYAMRAANRGSPEGQTTVGASLVEGLGVKAQPRKGIAWLEKAVAQDHVAAQSYLGVILYNGRHGGKNRPRAVALLRKAARRGDAAALQALREIDGEPKPYAEGGGPLRR